MNIEALEVRQAVLPEAKRYTANLSGGILIAQWLLDMDRDHEAHAEAVAYAKANFSPENSITLTAVKVYASTLIFEEAKAYFKDALTIETRVPEHLQTRLTLDRYLRLEVNPSTTDLLTEIVKLAQAQSR